MIDKHQRLDQIASYVTGLFTELHNSNLVYHNLVHTQTVTARAIEIGEYYKIGDEDLLILLAGSWFHDIGHLFGPALDHELRGALKMREFMETMQIDNRLTESIQACILSTRLPTNPTTFLEQILCDADLYHLGTAEFFTSDMLVKREYELRNGVIANNWYENSMMLQKQHRFYTQYCRDLLDKGKSQNLKSLELKIESINNRW